MAGKVYTKEQLETAKELYFDYRSLEEIGNATGIGYPALKYYAKKYWFKERNLKKIQIIQAMGDARGQQFAEICQNGMQLLVRSLKDHVKNGTVLSVKESFALSNIITNLDKMARLDEGAPTDIVSDITPATREEVIKVVEIDPFYKKLPPPGKG